MTGTSVLIAFAALCIATAASAESCIRIAAPSIPWGLCPSGQHFFDDFCCETVQESCYDEMGADFCPRNADKCNVASIKNAMSQQCAKTCNTCDQQSGSPPSGDCVDKLVDCIKDVYKCHDPSLALTEQNQTTPSILPQTPISATTPPTMT